MRNRTLLSALLSAATLTGGGAFAAGPDVMYSNCGDIMNYGNVGGIRGYAIGSNTCNIGSINLLWVNNGTPGLAMNAYRLHNGRLIQLGQGWVKHACCAAAGNGCNLACNGQGGNVLGAGCLDVYSAGWNGGQSRLGARSGINAFTGAFSAINTSSGNAIFKRLQILESDLVTASFPGALYFVEGEYVGSDDATSGNAMNNVSYKRVTVGGGFALSPVGAMFTAQPAINAWRDHGGGAGIPDPSVTIGNLDVPSEGRFVYGYKAIDLGGGNWRYEYAIFNLNSDRSGGSFTVPLPAGATVTNVGFRDVPYHSGEPYDNTDWTATVNADNVTWASPQTFAQNPNSNALRWGTMYNFWFEANRAPIAGEVTMGLFKPHTPQTVAFTGIVPAGLCEEDIVGSNGAIDVDDLFALLTGWGPCEGKCPPGCTGDFDNSCEINIDDLAALIAVWGPCQ